MDFSNKNLGILFKLGDRTVYIDETFRSAWIVMSVLIIFAIIVRLMLPKFKDVPEGFQNVVESLVEAMSNFARTTMGEGMDFFGGIFFSLFAFILL